MTTVACCFENNSRKHTHQQRERCTEDVVKFLAARFWFNVWKFNLIRSSIALSWITRSWILWIDFQWTGSNDEDWLKTHSKRTCLAVSSNRGFTWLIWKSLVWWRWMIVTCLYRAWWSHIPQLRRWKIPIEFDTGDGNNHYLVDSAMEIAWYIERFTLQIYIFISYSHVARFSSSLLWMFESRRTCNFVLLKIDLSTHYLLIKVSILLSLCHYNIHHINSTRLSAEVARCWAWAGRARCS